MRMNGFARAAIIAAILPAGAAMAMQVAPAPDAWGGVPDVALRTPPPPADAGEWGAAGWHRDPRPVPAARGQASAPPAVSSRAGTLRPEDVRPVDRMRGRPQGGIVPVRGTRLPPEFLSPGYAVADWASFGLPAPAVGMRWIRYYDAAALIDGMGVVRDARDPMDWGQGYGGGDYAAGYTEGWRDGFGDGERYADDMVTDRGRRVRGRDAYRAGGPAYPPYGYGAPVYDGYGAGGPRVYSDGRGGAIVSQDGGTTTTVEETTYEIDPADEEWQEPVRRVEPRLTRR